MSGACLVAVCGGLVILLEAILVAVENCVYGVVNVRFCDAQPFSRNCRLDRFFAQAMCKRAVEWDDQAEVTAFLARAESYIASGPVAAGQAVVVDAVFAAPEERAAIEAAARDEGAPFTGLWLEAPSEILRQRVGARTGDPSDADVQVAERQQAYVVGELGSFHIIEASGTTAEIARKATKLVDRRIVR